MDRSNNREELVERIVGLQVHIAELLEVDRPQAWLELDLTIQQIKVVFLVVRAGSMNAGQIGRELRVGFSTITGVVDRLAEQGLVERGEDPNDRRATRVTPTQSGRDLVQRLYAYRRDALRRLLERVPTSALTQLVDGLASVEAAAYELQTS